MKIALFGATGHTGSFILEEALKAGHEVTVLLRDPAKMQLQHDRLRLLKGDALKAADVLEAIQNQDVVLSAISEGPDVKTKTQSVAVANMIDSMQKAGVNRIICMGAIGILQLPNGELIRDQPSYPSLYLPLSFEHSAVNDLLQKTDLLWMQVCPPTILGKAADGKFAVKANYPPTENMEVNAGNIGLFMMQELEQNNFLQQRVGITNA